MDNKISFLAGFIFTTVTTMSSYDLMKTAILGLVGGFFGIIGKEAYYKAKKEIQKWLQK